jgi:hypothetical protein
MKASAVLNLIDVGPCGEVYICFFFKTMSLSIDDHADVSLDDDDYEVIFRFSGFGVYDVVFSFDLAGENVIVYVSDSFDCFSAK